MRFPEPLGMRLFADRRREFRPRRTPNERLAISRIILIKGP
jgi:hypothetical protein